MAKTAAKDAPSPEARSRKTQERKDKNREANEAQHRANIEFLAAHGVKHPHTSYEHTTLREVKHGKTVEIVERTVTKYHTPSQLRRRIERSVAF